jgi:mannitol/fructose-specific phosphotransferase system IIA component (Ntr-type)
MAIALSDLLDEKQIALQLQAREQPAALREIVQLLAANDKIDNPEEFLEQLLAREQAQPSAVEHGVALPHIRTDLVDEIVIGIGRSSAGIPFGDDRANLIFVIGVPQRLVNDYLICVGTLARLLQDDDTRAALMRAKTAAAFVNRLRS